MLTRRALLATATVPAPSDLLVVHGHFLRLGEQELRCAVGRTGVRVDKREGDGATPVGRFPLREVLYRPDRGPAPSTGLPVSTIGPHDAWSDDPSDPAYNRRVTLPHPFHAEPLWRQDPLYDVLAVIGANDDPVIPGFGSAIFLHIARPDYGGTDGCIALARTDLLQVLTRCRPGASIDVRPRSP